MIRAPIPIHQPRIQRVIDLVFETSAPISKISAWVDILEQVRHKLHNGYLTPRYRQSDITGGWHTRSPNLQGLRGWMLAELIDDTSIVSCDYVAMHPAIAGWLFNDKRLLDAYQNNSVYTPFTDMIGKAAGKVALLALMNMASARCIAERCCGGDETAASGLIEAVYDHYPIVRSMNSNKEMGDSMRRMACSVFNKKALSLKRRVKIYLLKHDELIYSGKLEAPHFNINMDGFIIRAKHKTASELKESRHERL